MATIQDMAETASSIRRTFEGILGSLGEKSDPQAVMCAIGDMYINIVRLDGDLREAATPSSENNTGGGAAEKMPGGGAGNFDREGGLDFSNLSPIRNPEYESGGLTGNIDNFMPWYLRVDDTTFHAEITVPMKVLFKQKISDVAAENPDISLGVAHKASGGHLYAAVQHGSGDFLFAIDDVLVKAEKLQALPEYQKAYDHWKTRAKAYRRGVVDARNAA